MEYIMCSSSKPMSTYSEDILFMDACIDLDGKKTALSMQLFLAVGVQNLNE